MQLGSYVLSLLLHVAVLVLAMVWPSQPPVDMNKVVYQVSLVEGAPGGEMLPSPVLGRTGKPNARAKAESLPSPKTPRAATAEPARAPENVAAKVDAQAVKAPEKPAEAAPRPESRAAQVPVPPTSQAAKEISAKKADKEDALPLAAKQVKEKKQPEEKPRAEAKKQPKPEVRREESKPVMKEEVRPEPKKEQEKQESREDALKQALADAKKNAKPETTSSKKSGKGSSKKSSRDDAVAGALAEMRRNSEKQGTGGGGGGEGGGPGGGGIYDVYAGLVIMAVQPNWSTATFASRQNIAVVVRISLDTEGNVLDCHVERSSGNPGFDGSAVNAVRRTRVLPKPPTPEQQDLIVTFNSQDMMVQ